MNPYREGEIVRRFYIGTNGHVLCIDATTGEPAWTAPLGLLGGSVSMLLHGGRIYAVATNLVACLEAAEGKEIWRTDLGRCNTPAALALDLTLPEPALFVAGLGMLYALRAADGALLWKNGLKGMGYNPICLRAPGMITSQPLPYRPPGENASLEVLEDDQGRG
jgi:outer membrane protein assembly factor BamB